ncbi:MAG: response regulator transcription factor [Alphaproteobacteria bacterium]|nr:response regulator transcription factor [Alphaproteobacteria bacterium]
MVARQSSEVLPSTGVKLRVLIVEDDPAISKMLKTYLEREGYAVAAAGTVADMRSAIEGGKIDLVLLDVVLPDEDGWSALRWVRARGDLPVIMLTGKGETVDKVIGLELGADDYLAKPFDMRELLARMRSIHRRAEKRSAPNADEAIAFAGWRLDVSSQQLKAEAGDTVHLTQAEYRILVLLAKNPRSVITRDQLMDAMAGREWEPLDRSIDVHISNLRRKLDPDPKQPSLIRTVRGAGYMFVPNRGA